MKGRPINLIGERFDRLLVLSKVRSTPSGSIWLCRCDCGALIKKLTTSLRRLILSGKNRHTGCSSCEKFSRSDSSALTTHGGAKLGKSRLYLLWKGIKARCQKEYATSWRYYGAKGIELCKQWLDFSAFRKWAIGYGYSDALTIDRVDPKWHYDPSNCEWVSKSVNSWRRSNPGHYWRSMTCNA